MILQVGRDREEDRDLFPREISAHLLKSSIYSFYDICIYMFIMFVIFMVFMAPILTKR